MARQLRIWISLLCLMMLSAPLRAQKSPTDQLIQSLELHVKMYPQDYAGYDGLGAAFLQKGRETGDADYYERAKMALNKSLDLRSGDPSAASAMTNMAVACMSEHRFADALDWAQNALALGSGQAGADHGPQADEPATEDRNRRPFRSQPPESAQTVGSCWHCCIGAWCERVGGASSSGPRHVQAGPHHLRDPGGS